MDSTNTNKWVSFYRPQTDVKHRLVCFHHAGGGASSFCGWQKLLGSKVEVLPIQLPYRENRLDELSSANYEVLIDNIVEAILPYVESMPFSTFGHSMGAMVALLVIQKLYTKYGLIPRNMFVSSSKMLADGEKVDVSTMDDNQFLEYVKRYGGIDAQVFNMPNYRSMFLNVLRNDFNMIYNLKVKSFIKLPMDVTFFGGTSDATVNPVGASTWEQYTTNPIKSHWYDGNHFYINEHRAEVCDILSSKMLD